MARHRTSRIQSICGAVVVVIVAAGLLAGCSPATGGGGDRPPVTGPVTSADPVWDPASLPASAVRQMGLDTTVEPQCSPIPGARDVKSCHWNSFPPSADYSFGALMFSTRLTFDQLRARAKFHDLSPARVGDRPATRFGVNNNDLGERCDLAWTANSGTTRWVSIVADSTEYQVDSCRYVDKWASIVFANSPE